MARLWALLSLLLSFQAFAERPRLGVVVIVDQLSADAFHAREGKVTSGIKRLLTEGYVFSEARYEASPSITSIGHATLVTGAYASVHGIASNDWLDAETGQPTLSTQDPSFKVLGREPQERDGTAPTLLRAPTLSDAARLADERAQAVSVSGKDRSAILCAGRAGLAVWLDAEKPFFTTSTFYAAEPPAFLKATNDKLAEGVLRGVFAWGLPAGGVTGQAPRLPPRASREGDSEPFVERLELQAPIDSAEVDVALEAVKTLGLGKDEVPDLLTISFSGHDRVGHGYGPDSEEGLAEFLHVDRELGRLLAGLDALVGKGRYVVALSSDHGAAPRPELAKQRGLDAGRVDVKALQALLDKELDEQLGRQDWFAGWRTPGYTFTPALRRKALPQVERLRALARTQPGVFDLVPLAALDGPVGALYARNAVPGRSPDLILVPKPHWTFGARDVSGHVSPWLYDRSVPLVFMGPGVKRGQGGTTEPIHLAPTLARLLGIPTPAAAQGRPLDEVFAR